MATAGKARKPSHSYRGIGARVAALRRELGLSQRQASGPSVSYAYISRIEAGTRRPSLDALITLASRLETTALYLLSGDHDASCPVCGRAGEQDGGRNGSRSSDRG